MFDLSEGHAASVFRRGGAEGAARWGLLFAPILVQERQGFGRLGALGGTLALRGRARGSTQDFAEQS